MPFLQFADSFLQWVPTRRLISQQNMVTPRRGNEHMLSLGLATSLSLLTLGSSFIVMFFLFFLVLYFVARHSFQQSDPTLGLLKLLRQDSPHETAMKESRHTSRYLQSCRQVSKVSFSRECEWSIDAQSPFSAVSSGRKNQRNGKSTRSRTKVQLAVSADDLFVRRFKKRCDCDKMFSHAGSWSPTIRSRHLRLVTKPLSRRFKLRPGRLQTRLRH